MKRKTLVGIIAITILLVLTFLGLFYQLEGSMGLSIIFFIILASLAVGTLYLATTGRETHEKHNTLWSVVGWISGVAYLIIAICCWFFANSFISARCDMGNITQTANRTIDSIDLAFTNYDDMVQMAEGEVMRQLSDWRMNNELTKLNQFSGMQNSSLNYYDNSYIKTAVKGINDLYYLDTQTEIQNKYDEWTRYEKDYYRNQLKDGGANIFTFVTDAVALDMDFNRINENMSAQHHSMQMVLKDMGIDTKDILLKAPIQPSPTLTEMVTNASGKTPTIINILMFILLLLTLVPFLFVKLNKVQTDNKRFSNIYNEGFSL